MAIPRSSQPPTSRQRTILRVSVLTALATSAYALALWAGILPDALRPSERDAPPPAAPTCPKCAPELATPNRSPGPAPGSVPEPAALHAPAPVPAPNPTTSTPRRFSICESPSGEAVAQTLWLSHTGPPWIGVHCGTSIHLIAFDRSEPRRILKFELEAGSAAASGYRQRAGRLLAADVNGDGAMDLVVGNTREDEHGSPRGGALYEFVRAASGSFEPPRLLAPLAVGEVHAAAFDDSAGADLAVLRLEEARLARGSEVVLLRGGPAPIKLRALPAGVGTDRLAVADFDLDGHPDLILAMSGHAPELVLLDPAGQSKERMPLAMPAVKALHTGDLNGDGHADALLAGDELGTILASASREWAIRPLPALRGLDVVQLVDWNADGKLDVVGLLDHSLVAFIQTGALAFEAQPITAWPDRALRLLLALPKRAIGGSAGVILIASPVQARGRAELILAEAIPSDATLADPEPLPDAPLSQRFATP